MAALGNIEKNKAGEKKDRIKAYEQKQLQKKYGPMALTRSYILPKGILQQKHNL